MSFRARFWGAGCQNWVTGTGPWSLRSPTASVTQLFFAWRSCPAASGLMPWRRARTHFHDSLRPRPDYVHHRIIVVDLLQNRLCGLQFDEFASAGLIFPSPSLLVESKFLITVIVSEMAAKLERRRNALKQRGQLLDGGLRRKIVTRRRLAPAVFVGELLGARIGQLVVAGVDLAGKIIGLGSKIKDAGARCVRKVEFGLIVVAVFGFGRYFCRTFVAAVSVRSDRDGIVVRIGSGKIQR